MFNLSGSEIVVILLLALVVLGPEKLPDALRRAGRTYAELKKMGNSFQAEVRSALDEPMKEMKDTADLMRNAADFTGPAVASSLPADELDDEVLDDADDVDIDADAEDDEDDEDDEDLINRTLSGGAPPYATDESPTT